ncbi:dynein axonemal heavy chain 1 [Armigeres subalbatus]|uniref:dynein axonemal heavy chain 1 n=1 Tax=Armigeres subalbatus TaxID=124917 RepID=UPI002ED59CEA
MSYPELDWRVSFQEQVKSRKSLFEIALAPRKSVKSSKESKIAIDIVPAKSTIYKFMQNLIIRLREPFQLERILRYRGIKNEVLFELESNPQLISNKDFLPLEWFDDFEYDPMSAERWLSISNLEGFALIPDPGSEEWNWRKVTVVDYDQTNFFWTVMDNNERCEVPRVRLYLLYEDPGCFCERIASALNSRNDAENRLRFYYLRQLVDVEGYFDLPDEMSERISKKSSGDALVAFKFLYRKFHLMLALNSCLVQNEWLNIQPIPTKMEPIPRCIKDNIRDVYVFESTFATIKRITMLCHPAVVKALQQVHIECEKVKEKSLFALEFKEPVTLAEFKTVNVTQIVKTMQYLKNRWIEKTTMKVHQNLLETGRGWFDVSVKDWTIYRFMKLHRLIEQIKYRMQTALRDVVLTSTDRYFHQLCDPCSLALIVDEEFTWEDNLIDSPFDSGLRPVFYLLLEMGDDTPYYSTHPDEFEPCLEMLFEEAVANTHDVHIIDPSLLGSLIFDPVLFLSSVGLLDPVIQQRRDFLTLTYRKTIIPLKAYAARYLEFKELFFTNVADYVENVKLNKTSLQVKEEISFQIRMRESLERTLPFSIVIGSFWINVRPLRDALILKRQELTAALLKMLTERLCAKTSDIVSEYNDVNEKMCEKPISIEHIFEIRAFMETIPEQLQNLEERMKAVAFEYEILEFFRHALPDSDFYQKWQALAFPQNILKQMTTVSEFNEGEVDRFRKQQVSDEAEFGGKVEEINVYISKFTTLYDVAKVAEISIEVKKLWKTINELIQYGETLNKRQELFELNAIDLSNLFDLKESFVDYKNLWSLAAEYINVEESWQENPLSSLELESVSNSVAYYRTCFTNLMDSFEDQPQIKEVVKAFVERVEAFEPHLSVIKLLQHPLLQPIHWAQLAKAAGIKVKISLASNFQLFLEHRIELHLEVLRDLIQKAEEQKEESERIQAEQEEIWRKEQEYLRQREARRLQRTEI